MILNGYAVLDAFVSLLRLGLGLAVVWQAFRLWRRWRQRFASPEQRTAVEDRGYLVYALAGLLLGLNVVAWPILYLLLQSYVREWPGVMCIYGVTRVGAGTIGPSRFLPALVTALEVLKPGVVFLSGAWFVMYLANRETRTAPLTGRVLAVLLASTLLVVADAAAELAYLAIPKQEEFLASGCCSEISDGVGRASRFLPQRLVPELGERAWYTAFVGVNLGQTALLAWAGRRPMRWLMPFVFFGVLAAAAISGMFLVEVASPRLLHLPDHHCPYDLVGESPESLVAIGMFGVGSLCALWGCVASSLGRHEESARAAPRLAVRLFQAGCLAYTGSLILMTVELAFT